VFGQLCVCGCGQLCLTGCVRECVGGCEGGWLGRREYGAILARRLLHGAHSPACRLGPTKGEDGGAAQHSHGGCLCLSTCRALLQIPRSSSGGGAHPRPDKYSAVAGDTVTITYNHTGCLPTCRAPPQIPRSVEVELTSDLVSGAVVGDTVTIMGWVKVLATGDDVGECAGALEARQRWGSGCWPPGMVWVSVLEFWRHGSNGV